MLKKILLILSILFAPVLPVAHAAEMVNVEYIHQLIARDWDITIPYNPALSNPKVAANMKYLLTAIDVANQKLNGKKTTDYGNGEYATMYAADTTATNTAVRTLIKKKIEPKFFITTTADTTEFSFTISAKGNFAIDWGDGEVQEIERTNTTQQTYSHTYSTAKADGYTIGIGGLATEYSTDSNLHPAAISFSGNNYVATISGSLGAIFPTIGDGNLNGQQPRFYNTFNYCNKLTGKIPETLFAGVSGAPADYMFEGTFYGCRGLSGEIPAGLFAGIKGAPAEDMFSGTFMYCSGLSGKIPANLFAGIEGAPASGMFRSTFYGCSGLSGKIPAGLFAGIEGAPASDMFVATFYGCSGLTEIPAGLFAKIQGAPASSMFSGTFMYCRGLSGEIPAGLFAGIQGPPAYSMFYQTFGNCSGLTGSIPSGLFSGIKGAPAESMFYQTFGGCSGLSGSIPAGLFGSISGTAQIYMFYETFYGCTNLSGCVPNGLFAGIENKNFAEIVRDYKPFQNSGISQELCPSEYPFTATTTQNTDSFEIYLSAIGTFTIDWGDGGVQEITRTNTDLEVYSHTYATAGEYTIGIDGRATGYAPSEEGAPSILLSGAVMTGAPCNIAAVDGSLGAIFPTIGDGSGAGQQPSFLYTFARCDQLANIPEGLFKGVKGAPVPYMFADTFWDCSGLTGEIPAGLFAGIEGTSAEGMFLGTFSDCTNLSGCVPNELFAGIEDKNFAAIVRDDNPFRNSGISQELCQQETGQGFTITTRPDVTDFSFSISAKGNFTIDWGDGEIQEIKRTNTDAETYSHTYSTKKSYTIGITGRATEYSTDIETAAISFMSNGYLSTVDGSLGAVFGTIGDGSGVGQQPRFYGTFAMTTLTSIPGNLFAGVSGAPTENMFGVTFFWSSLTKIPSGLFAGISGAPADGMFFATFAACAELSGASAKIGGRYLYEIWPDATTAQVGQCYMNSSGLSDYNQIPDNWK